MDTIFEWLKDRNIAYSDKTLITQALVHSSYVNEHKSYAHDNERLEFMGDAVLQLWTTKKLFLLEPELSEGQMTTLRAQLVCEEALAEYNRQLGLGKYLMLGVGEEKPAEDSEIPSLPICLRHCLVLYFWIRAWLQSTLFCRLW